MLKVFVLLFLLGILDAANTQECAGCTAPGASDADCTITKKYVKCIEDKDKITQCIPKSSDLTHLPPNDCTLKAGCNCQVTYWKTDLKATDQPCKALKKYKDCLDKLDASSDKGCNDEPISTLSGWITNKLTGKPCSTPDGTVMPTTGTSKGTVMPTTGTSKDGARAVETSGLIVTIILSILGMFFM